VVEIFNGLVSTLGFEGASWTGIVVVILGTVSFVASQIDSVWSSESQPKWLRPIIAFAARNTGKAANDPAAQ